MSDIRVTKGDSFSFSIYVTREDSAGADIPVNLTGAKLWFTVKASRRDLDVDALIDKNSVDHPTAIRAVVPATQGLIAIDISAADSVLLGASYFPYDVQIKESNGLVTTVEQGFLEVNRDATITTA